MLNLKSSSSSSNSSNSSKLEEKGGYFASAVENSIKCSCRNKRSRREDERSGRQ